ncbi:hypothetical protein BDY17DRAFT_141246 [Neohortaea acidophila]|uniref:Apple domain-containing protein n=1 Tax=Neohortaea acidophila TaxID=245834 RepID=A0A6A6PSY7_9PEZI|nr:uncharacterized protein BDY17DRAFT_141246 [Neohortaea acidophila]KAF2483092.1 hypothetical protein BDY17DRAFT_141246 [Neohortaea acidophila]
MVQTISLGLLAFCALSQIASAAPAPVPNYTTVITKTVTFLGTHHQKPHTKTETVNSVVKTTSKTSPTESAKTKSTKTKTSSTTTASPSPTTGTCASIGSGSYTDSDGVSYTVACGTDFYGGDLTHVEGASFESCFAACDNTSGCVAFSWVGQNGTHVGPGDCYLKSTLEQGDSNSAVDGAYKNQ